MTDATCGQALAGNGADTVENALCTATPRRKEAEQRNHGGLEIR